MRRVTKVFGAPLKGWISLLFCAGCLLGAPTGLAQEKEDDGLVLEEMSAADLLSEASRLLVEEKQKDALPFLINYLDRMKDSRGKRLEAMMQSVRFDIGKIYLYLGNPSSSFVYFENYMENKPVPRRLEALKLLAVTCFEACEYEKSIAAVLQAFAPPPLDEVQKKVNLKDLSKEERGGLSVKQLLRYQKYGNESDFESQGVSDAEETVSTEYTLDEQVLLNRTLAESYVALQQWKNSVEPFQFVIEYATKREQKDYAALQQIHSLIELKDFEWTKRRMEALLQSDLRYDLGINIATLDVAAALFNAGDYDSSLKFYRLVLPKQVLSDQLMAQMNSLRTTAGFPPVELIMNTNDLGRTETLFGTVYSDANLSDSKSLLADLPEEAWGLERSILELWSIDAYEQDVLYRLGELYHELGRPWEALASFDCVAAYDLNCPLGINAFSAALGVLRDPLELYDRLEKRAVGFLDRHKEGLAPRQVAYQLTMAYQSQDRMTDIKKLRPILDAFIPSDDSLTLKYECDLYYMQAIADLVLLNYKEARSGFAEVLVKYPDSHQVGNLTYWHAMTQLFLQEYEKGLVEFEDYLSRFPNGVMGAPAWFHCGVCLFALEKYEPATERFTHVIENFKESSVYPDACSMRGDLRAAVGKLNEAQRDYEEAIATARNSKQDTYAVFQMTAMFELEKRYEEIIAVVNAYLERRADEADVAKAAYWIGKTKLDQGLIAETVVVYRDTIVKYGGNIRQDGVDLIINELITVSRRLKDDELLELKESLNAALEASDNETLSLRLRTLTARLEGTELKLGKELILALKDLTQAPPPVLAVICDASFVAKDYSRAEEILTLFLNHFEDSEFMRSAYKLRATDLYLNGEPTEALKLVDDAQALYGADTDMAWAQLMKGQLEEKLGDLETARKTLRKVFGVRFWRGASYAEAACRLGELEESAGNLKRAFAWYQRTYTLYKGYAKGYWAAEAYLNSARVLKALGLYEDAHNTYRAMLYDKYVNTLPQAETAHQEVTPTELEEIATWLTEGVQTNLTVTIEAEETP